MLERVPASAESAAAFFLRNADRPLPCRSSRTLDPRFWQPATASCAQSTWWPLYLQRIRQSSQRRHTAGDDPLIAFSSARDARTSHHATPSTRLRLPLTTATRPYSVSAPASQAQASKKIDDVPETSEESVQYKYETERSTIGKGLEGQEDDGRRLGVSQTGRHNFAEGRHANHGPTSPDLTSTFNTFQSSDTNEASPPPTGAYDQARVSSSTRSNPVLDSLSSPQESSAGSGLLKNGAQPFNDIQELRESLAQRGKQPQPQHFAKAWQIFVASRDQASLATATFDFLRQSSSETDIVRALEALRLIPYEQRTATIYKSALQLTLSRFKYTFSIDLAYQALGQGESEPLNYLFSYLVQNLLWSHCASLLSRNDIQNNSNRSIHKVSLSHLIRSCLTIPNLHLKVLSLADRLHADDPTLLDTRKPLTDLCMSLLNASVASELALKTIPPSALLAILKLEDRFAVNPLHPVALGTILKLPNRSSKADLALMVYRNHRFLHPDAFIPKWMLGGLISVCSVANYELSVYDYLLKEFSLHHGQPDEAAFQRVLTSCARRGNLPEVERVFAQYLDIYKKPKNVTFVSPLLYACAVSGNVEQARRQFSRIEEYGFKSNLHCWNMLLLAHARSHDDLAAFDLFDQFSANGVQPDSYSYGTLLAICERHADIETALSVLSKARDNQCHISIPMVNTLVEIFLANNDVKTALQFVNASIESAPSHSLTRLWNTFAFYFANRGDPNGVRMIRKRMAATKSPPDEMTYAAILTSCTTLGKTAEAIGVLREMHESKGFAVGQIHYGIVLSGFVRERNRDMVTIVAREMARKFPSITSDANAALLLLQSKQAGVNVVQDEQSVQLLTSVLEDLYSRGSTRPDPDSGLDNGVRHMDVSSLLLDTVITSYIRSGSYNVPIEILKRLKAKLDINSASFGNEQMVTQFANLEMRLAAASGDYQSIQDAWGSLFALATNRYRSLRDLRDSRAPQAKTGPTLILSAWQFSLSKPLNTFIDAMCNSQRQSLIIDFVEKSFQPAGFKLTSFNVNRYVQALCLSTSPEHHIMAFKMSEDLLINRAQNWQSLRRGLIRQKHTTYSFKSTGSQRPVLEKENRYSAAKRSDAMRNDPHRMIPTYLTMVHLGSVLLKAQEKASRGKPREIQNISAVARTTKRFVQQMPFLKDDIQRTLLRGHDHVQTKMARPRSEDSMRARVIAEGIIDDGSLLDRIPAEFVSDAEDLAAPYDDLRSLLRDKKSHVDTSPITRDELRIGEKFFGQISRDPVILAAKARFETAAENQRRLERQERELVAKVRVLRKELRERKLTGAPFLRDFESPVGPSSEVADEYEAIAEHSALRTADSLLRLKPSREILPIPAQQMAVLQQSRLDKQEAAQRRGSNTPVKALTFIERRRRIRLAALRQRHAALRQIQSLGLENFSDRALKPRTAAGRRFAAHAMARRRLAELREYEARLARGQRMDPLPKTERGWWKRLASQAGVLKVRFVEDKNRRPLRYLVRRGILIEKRQPRLDPPLMKDGRMSYARFFNDRLSLDRNSRKTFRKKKDIIQHKRLKDGLTPINWNRKFPRRAAKMARREATRNELQKIGFTEMYHPLLNQEPKVVKRQPERKQPKQDSLTTDVSGRSDHQSTGGTQYVPFGGKAE